MHFVNKIFGTIHHRQNTPSFYIFRRPARRGSFRLLLSNNEDIELSEIGETESVLSSDGGTSVKRSVSAMSQSICQHCGKLSSYNINGRSGAGICFNWDLVERKSDTLKCVIPKTI